MGRVVASVFLIFAISMVSTMVFAQEKAATKVLLISDIDDTIKISHILDLTEKVTRVTDYTAAFTGMAQLYQLIINMNPTSTKVVYLSNAPEKILDVPVLQWAHSHFLAYNKFPKGELILRTDTPVAKHKLFKIRELIDREMPDQVIFVGDNGEADIDVYHQLTPEYEALGVKMVTFIHLLYSSKVPFYEPNFLAEKGRIPESEQFGYVTPMEIALQLQQENMLNQESVDWMIKNVSPYIVKESLFQLSGGRPFTFPLFSNCGDFRWRWSETPALAPLIEKLKHKCN